MRNYIKVAVNMCLLMICSLSAHPDPAETGAAGGAAADRGRSPRLRRTDTPGLKLCCSQGSASLFRGPPCMSTPFKGFRPSFRRYGYRHFFYILKYVL